MCENLVLFIIHSTKIIVSWIVVVRIDYLQPNLRRIFNRNLSKSYNYVYVIINFSYEAFHIQSSCVEFHTQNSEYLKKYVNFRNQINKLNKILNDLTKSSTSLGALGCICIEIYLAYTTKEISIRMKYSTSIKVKSLHSCMQL